MAHGGVETVHEDARTAQACVIGLAHVGAVGADQVHMLAGLQPVPADQRVGGHGGGGHDIGGAHGGLQIVRHLQARTVRGHRVGIGAGAVPDGEARAGKRRSVGLPERPAHGPCPHDQDVLAVGPRQTRGGIEAVAGGLPLGHQMEIHKGGQRAVRVVVKVHRAVDPRRAALGIAGKDRGAFHRDPHAVDPRRAVQQRIGAAVQEGIGDLGAGQLVAGLKRRAEAEPVEIGLARVKGNDGQAHGHLLVLRKRCQRR